MRSEEVVGRNVKEARESASLTQRELGERIGEVLGKAWLPQAVSQAEKGGRDWVAQDLIAVAWALRRPVAWFFKVPNGVSPTTELDLPKGAPALQLAWVAGEAATERTADEIAAEIARLSTELLVAAKVTPTLPAFTQKAAANVEEES